MIKEGLAFIALVYITLFPVFSIGKQGGEITSQEIISHIRYLSSDELQGRKAGTQGANIAAKYIAEEFSKAGLKPLGDQGTYFQKFPVLYGMKIGDANSLALEYGKRRESIRIGEDYIPISFSSTGETTGDLVFAGYGISAPELNYDDYERIDIKDKIVLVLRFTPESNVKDSPFYKYAPLRYKAINARKKGAKGIIFMTPSSVEEEAELGGLRFDPSFTDSGIQAVVLRRDIGKTILSYADRDLKSLELALSNKKNSSFNVPETTVYLQTDLIAERSYTTNVIGLLEGSNPDHKREVIVIGAHYDHIGLGGNTSRHGDEKKGDKIYNGADDNASGVSGLLELAEYFSHEKESLDSSLLFVAFSAEELGILGSSYYVKNPKIPLENAKAMINMDMIGRLKNNELTVFGVGSSPAWQGLINDVNSGVGLVLKLRDSGIAPSDQTVFYTKNIPVLHFFTGIHSDYHAPSDEWQKINPEGEEKVLMLISDLILELNGSLDMIAFSKVKGEEKSPSGFNVYLGTIPDYSENPDGVRLMGVRGGSPAEKAGLKDGDVIIEFSGERITNIYDYVVALGEAQAGIKTDIMIKRDKKLMEIMIVPEPRIDGE